MNWYGFEGGTGNGFRVSEELRGDFRSKWAKMAKSVTIFANELPMSPR
jgi:hypothetical protein